VVAGGYGASLHHAGLYTVRMRHKGCSTGYLVLICRLLSRCTDLLDVARNHAASNLWMEVRVLRGSCEIFLCRISSLYNMASNTQNGNKSICVLLILWNRKRKKRGYCSADGTHRCVGGMRDKLSGNHDNKEEAESMDLNRLQDIAYAGRRANYSSTP